MSKAHNQKHTKQKPVRKEAGPVPAGKARQAGFHSPSWKAGIAASLTLLILAFLLYGKSINYGYVLDDSIVITDNIYTTRGIKGIPDLLSKETFEGYFKQKKILVEGGRYRPLSLITFATEWSLFAKEKKDQKGLPMRDNAGSALREGNPHISHFFNILLYGLTGALIYFLLFILFRQEKGKQWWWNIPFAGALLFILHPIHTEAVANIKGRDEILALLLSLLALYCSIRYIQASTASRKFLYLFLSGIFFFLGLLSKENAITFLAIIPLTIYFFTPAKTAANFRTAIPLLVAVFIYMLMRMNAIGPANSGKEITNLMNNPFYGMSFGDKYATIFYTLILYFKLLIFPSPLTIDYWPFHIPQMHWYDLTVIFSFVFYVILAVIAWMGFKRKSVISYCILFFLITLSVTSNIFFPIGSFMNERFIYMSSLAFCILVAFLLVRVMPEFTGSLQGKINYAGMILLAVFSTGFILKTFQRVPDWKDEISLNSSAVSVSRNSARANCFMGVAIYRHEYLPKWEAVKNKQATPGISGLKADTLQLLTMADSINHYLNKAINIYPEYYSALSMKCGIAAELFKLREYDLGKLLAVYDTLLNTGEEIPFIKEFTSYLPSLVSQELLATEPAAHARALSDATMLKDFFMKAYHYYSDIRADKQKSREYLRLAAQVLPDDPLVREALDRERMTK